jgi:outer membrane lipoprotein-sorting protein
MTLIRTMRAALGACAAVAMCVPATAAPDGKQILIKMGDAMTRTLTSAKSYQVTIAKVEKSPTVNNVGRLQLKMVAGKKLRAEVLLVKTPMAGGKPAGKPSKQAILAVDDGTAQWIYQSDKKTCMRNAPGASNLARFLAALAGLPLDMRMQLTNVKAVIAGRPSVQGRPAYLIVVSPAKPGSPGITNAEVTVDQATNRLRMIVTKSGTTVSTLTIVSEILDKPIPAGAFKFTPPPGTKVTGLAAPTGAGRPAPRR